MTVPPPGLPTGYPQKMVFGSDKRAIRAIERLEDDYKALRSRVDELGSANKRLQLEWTETYDKVRHQLSRMARRGDLPKANGTDEIVAPDATDESVLDPISTKIHARRNRSYLRTE